MLSSRSSYQPQDTRRSSHPTRILINIPHQPQFELNPMDSLNFLKAEIAKCKQSVQSLQTETSSLNTLYEKAALSQCTNLNIPTYSPLASGYSKPFFKPPQETTSALPTYRSQRENFAQANLTGLQTYKFTGLQSDGFTGLQSDGFTRRTYGFTRRSISPTICQTKR